MLFVDKKSPSLNKADFSHVLPCPCFIRPSLFTWLQCLTSISTLLSLSHSSSLTPSYLLTGSCSSTALCLPFTSSGFHPSLCSAVYLLLSRPSSICSPSSFFWPKCSGPQSVFSPPFCSLFFIPQAPLPSLFPWRIGPLPLYLSLRAASSVLLGLSKESIETAAKTSDLSSDC